MLRVDDLRVHLGAREVVQGVSLAIEPGAALGLVGPSGAGKSLCLRALLGLLPEGVRATGTIALDGRTIALGDVAAIEPLRGGTLGWVPQSPQASLDPTRRIGRELSFFARLHGRPDRPEHWLSCVGLERAVARAHPHELSVGMAQRAALAVALCCGPKVLLADEPTASLDAPVQHEILALLDRIRVEHGLALILVSHDLALVAERCAEIVVLDHGQGVERGAPESLLARPQHPITVALVDAARRSWSSAAEAAR